MKDKFFLAGDIGGTKTILALFSKDKGPYAPLFEKITPSRDIKIFDDAVIEFLAECGVKPEGCCFGTAGPVFKGGVTITKLGWQLTETGLQKKLQVGHVSLINDLAATAHALPILKKYDIQVLNKGDGDPQGNKTIIAPGTGLGEVFLTWGGDCYSVHSSEGGHCLFAPETKLQRQLLDFLSKRHGQITLDLLCSGRGIPLIYSFLKEKRINEEPEWLFEKLSGSDDYTPHIFDSALGITESTPIASKTIEIFLEILASEAATCALKILATGGVYLAGGIPPRILDFLKRKSFLDHFSSRVPFQEFLAGLPLAVVTNPKSALLGAAFYGMKRLKWTGQEESY